MYKYWILTFILTFCTLSISLSQRPEKPQKVRSSDLSSVNNTTHVLFQTISVTFPFAEDKVKGQVTDKQFRLRIESNVRIYFQKSSGDRDFILLAKIFNSTPTIKSIDYYCLEKNKIKKSQIKNLQINIESDNEFYYANFSSLIKDSIAIIDLVYSVTTENKDFIVLHYPDNTRNHESKVTIDIPEIYTYTNAQISDCLNLKSISKLGNVRGYQLANSPSSIIGEGLMEVFKSTFPGSKYEAVYFRINSNTYTRIEDCKVDSTSDAKPFISLVLSKTTELK